MTSLKLITDPKIKTLFIINRGKETTDNLGGAFVWSNSPEGREFWHYVGKNPTVSFSKIKHLLPKNYKHKNEFIKVDSLYRIAVPGMEFKAVTKYGVEFQGVIAIKGGMVYLCNNKSIGSKCSHAPGYKYYLHLDKGGKKALLDSNIKSVSILYDPELETKNNKCTYVNSIEDVTPGTEFTARIGSISVKGKIQHENGCYFLCQDKKYGLSCKNKLGYKYSWSIGSGDNLKHFDVTNFKIESTVKPKSTPSTEYKPVKTLKGVKSGTKFTAKIERTEVEGKIQKVDDRYYLCQDKKNGKDCRNKLGYKYSWTVGNGSGKEIKNHDVTNLKVEITKPVSKVEPPTVYKDLQVTFCKDHVVINGVKITDEQLEGIAIAQGLFEIVG